MHGTARLRIHIRCMAYAFMERVINLWNSFDAESVSAVSVNGFKKKTAKVAHGWVSKAVQSYIIGSDCGTQGALPNIFAMGLTQCVAPLE